jgi:hypothetical protein
MILVGFYKRPELKGYFNFYKIGEAKKQGRNCLFFLRLPIFMGTILRRQIKVSIRGKIQPEGQVGTFHHRQSLAHPH